jgi:hypothetical protein
VNIENVNKRKGHCCDKHKDAKSQDSTQTRAVIIRGESMEELGAACAIGKITRRRPAN